MEAQTKGEQSYLRFNSERLESEPPKTKFHDPVRKLKLLKTFSNLSKKTITQVSGKTLILKTDRSLFGRIIIIAAQSRNLNMKEVFTYSLRPLPWALSTPEGELRKTAKATLARSIQKLAAPAESMPENSATNIDGTGLIQRDRSNVETFGNVASVVHDMVIKNGFCSQRTDVVFDVYKDISIKVTERTDRGQEKGHQLQHITATHLERQ